MKGCVRQILDLDCQTIPIRARNGTDWKLIGLPIHARESVHVERAAGFQLVLGVASPRGVPRPQKTA